MIGLRAGWIDGAASVGMAMPNFMVFPPVGAADTTPNDNRVTSAYTRAKIPP